VARFERKCCHVRIAQGLHMVRPDWEFALSFQAKKTTNDFKWSQWNQPSLTVSVFCSHVAFYESKSDLCALSAVFCDDFCVFYRPLFFVYYFYLCQAEQVQKYKQFILTLLLASGRRFQVFLIILDILDRNVFLFELILLVRTLIRQIPVSATSTVS